MKIRLLRNGKDWILLILFYLLLLQNVLGEWWSAFNYVDECLAMIGPVLYVSRALNSGKIVARKESLRLITALMVFFISGLLGNLIYDYQETSAVLEDIYVNFKFFMSILTGYELYVRCRPENCRRIFLSQAKVSAVILFLLLLIDLVFEVFESMGTRYGMRVVQLSYGHPTYLAGAMVYLMMALTLYYEKKKIDFAKISVSGPWPFNGFSVFFQVLCIYAIAQLRASANNFPHLPTLHLSSIPENANQ